MAWQAFMRYGRSFGTGFVVGLPIYITLTDYGFCIARVDGISMQPALNPGNESDVVLLDRWAARDVFNVKRGDVVSLTSPSEPDVKLIKRVIGLEGDVIKTLGYKKKYVSIPKGQCWLEGDHRGRSFDSNKFGPVSLGLVNGIATRIVWPPKRWMRIERYVENDRIPLRRSFNQCTFSEMLKKSKEVKENEDVNTSEDQSNREDIVALKKKFLSDDKFLEDRRNKLPETDNVYNNVDESVDESVEESVEEIVNKDNESRKDATFVAEETILGNSEKDYLNITSHDDSVGDRMSQASEGPVVLKS